MTLNEILKKLDDFELENREYVDAEKFWRENFQDISLHFAYDILNVDEMDFYYSSDPKKKAWPMNNGMVGIEIDLPKIRQASHWDGPTNHGYRYKGWINIINGKYKFTYEFHDDNDRWSSKELSGIENTSEDVKKLAKAYAIRKNNKSINYNGYIESICDEIAKNLDSFDDNDIIRLFYSRLVKKIDEMLDDVEVHFDDTLYIEEERPYEKLKLANVKVLDSSDWKKVSVLFKFKSENARWLPKKFKTDDGYVVNVEITNSIKTLIFDGVRR